MRTRRALEALNDRVEQLAQDQELLRSDVQEVLRRLSLTPEDAVGPRSEEDLDLPAVARAFTNLRRSVQQLSRHRAVQAAQLAELDELLRRTDDLEEVRKRVEQWLHYAGIRREVDRVTPEHFEVLGTLADDGELVAVTPAYLDAQSGEVIKRGTARSEAQGE